MSFLLMFLIGAAVGGLIGMAIIALFMGGGCQDACELDPYEEEFNEYR